MPRPAITRINGGFQVAANTTTNDNNGLYVPQLTTVQRDAIPAATLTNGTIIENTTTKTFEIRATYVTADVGVTTSAWLPLGVPVMTAVQGGFFEAANIIPGQMYIQSDGVPNGILRIHNGGAWASIATEV